MSRSFFDFFPAPKFLEMPAPGLSVTEAGVKFIEFKKERGLLSLRRYGEATFPQGAIVSGVIADRSAVSKVLGDFKKKYDIQYIRTTLPEERAYLFRTKIQNSADTDLRTSVEFTIEENVPITLAEAVFDYTILSRNTKEDGAEELEISVSVIPQEVVSEHLDLYRSAGFEPLHFEVESQAVAKSVVKFGETKPILVLNLNQSSVGIYLVSNGAVLFSSTIPVVPSSANVGATFADIDPVIDEMKKVLLYWQTQADKENLPVVTIDEVILCGEFAGGHGLVELITEKSKINARLANVWTNAFSLQEYIPDIPLEKSLGYASAIGLALPRALSEK